MSSAEVQPGGTSQTEFVWTACGGGYTIVEKVVMKPEQLPDPARVRLKRLTDVKANAGVPYNFNPIPNEKFLDRGK